MSKDKAPAAAISPAECKPAIPALARLDATLTRVLWLAGVDTALTAVLFVKVFCIG